MPPAASTLPSPPDTRRRVRQGGPYDDVELAASGPLSFRLSRQFFLRGLALVYLSAFLSMASQADGLIGKNGLLPVGEYLSSRPAAEPASTAWRYPTLLWLDHSDATIDAICLGGAMAAALMALGLLQFPLSAVCFTLYLSITVAGQRFFGEIWDALLLEAGFLAIFLAPWQLSLRPSKHAEPPRVVLWLLWWLLFRLLIGAGLSKLAWGEPAWRDGSALKYYFLVQPLPVFTSWYAARLPAWLLSAATWGLLFCELVLPIAILCGRWGRRLVFAPLVLFQLLILATGNYGVLNYLTIVLCLALLDDAAIRRIGRSLVAPYRWLMRSASPRPPTPLTDDAVRRWRWPVAVPVMLAACILPASVVQSIAVTPLGADLPAFARIIQRGVDPLKIVNGYGMYNVMPKDRVEVVIEASRDGENWRPVEFRFRPGDVTRPPRIAAPHMPRLDWCMWSLRWTDAMEQRWFAALLKGILEDRKPVTALLGAPAFPEKPRFLRIRAYRYRYSTPEQLHDGYWWQREYLFDVVSGRVSLELPTARP